jgi:hypothetical protein
MLNSEFPISRCTVRCRNRSAAPDSRPGLCRRRARRGVGGRILRSNSADPGRSTTDGRPHGCLACADESQGQPFEREKTARIGRTVGRSRCTGVAGSTPSGRRANRGPFPRVVPGGLHLRRFRLVQALLQAPSRMCSRRRCGPPATEAIDLGHRTAGHAPLAAHPPGCHLSFERPARSRIGSCYVAGPIMFASRKMTH